MMLLSWIFSELMLFGIIGGGDAIYGGCHPNEGTFEYVVKLIGGNNEECRSCTGAVIDSTHILTAAHCFDSGMKVIVIAGITNLLSEHPINRIAVKIHNHKKFKFSSISSLTNLPERPDPANDIAVLTLNEPLPLGDTINVINLPYSDFLPYGEHCVCAGWGEAFKGIATVGLRWTEMMILKAEECDRFHANHFPNEFCAIDLNSCALDGDSGAPLVYNNTVIGVISRSWSSRIYSTTFSKVFDHLDFIEGALED